MQWPGFQTSVPGKWVLAGEHSILKGATAVALPQSEVELLLSFQPDSDLSDRFSIEPAPAERLIQDLMSSVLSTWNAEGQVFPRPPGKLSIQSTIPVGAGFGSSAALCVALTRWMSGPLRISSDQWIEFATQLEHRFHGKSSGMDVAVISVGTPISFQMESGVRSIGVKQLPTFSFHDTGLRCPTRECVARVEEFRKDHPQRGRQVDETMSAASRLAIEGLVCFDEGARDQGIRWVGQAMQQARECFYAWDLVPKEVRLVEERLLQEGAVATKLTGAGGGGMVVALWA